MKKTLSLFLAVIMLFGAVSFSAFAEEEDKYAPEQYSDEEYAAGFSFKYVYVVIKHEYSFQEFTPEMLSAELVSKVEAPYSLNPDNDNYDKNRWELFFDCLSERTDKGKCNRALPCYERKRICFRSRAWIYLYISSHLSRVT